LNVRLSKNCLSLKSFPDEQTQLHYRAAKFNYLFFIIRYDLYYVVLLGADFQEKDLRVVGTLTLIPLANIQVANQALADFTMRVSLERRYPIAGGQMDCTRNPGAESKKDHDAAS